MFGFIKQKLQSFYTGIQKKFNRIFLQQSITSETLLELEKILIQADTGVTTTRLILNQLNQAYQLGKIKQGQDLKNYLSEILEMQLQEPKDFSNIDIFLLVGINGSGKTTFAAKLAQYLQKTNKKVLFIAGDTFRAAATEQLETWAQRLHCDLHKGTLQQDPGSVVFTGCKKFIDEHYDQVIIDTAGRLQTKVNLMKELEKIRAIINKVAPEKSIATLLIIDSMLGQNSLQQAKIFNEASQVDGIVLTKMDGTAKGGIVFSIARELSLPIAFISYGEQPQDLRVFNRTEFINDLMNE